MSPPRRLFALDQGFPQPIVASLQTSIREAELVWIGAIDRRLSSIVDWEILLCLHHHERPWDGLITTDQGMLNLPRVLAVLLQTKLTLVVAESAGHDPLKATGLLLTHLPAICGKTDPARPQVWPLRSKTREAEDPWDYIKRLALRGGKKPKHLYDGHKLDEAGLARNPLDD